jgi:hypothetical protein
VHVHPLQQELASSPSQHSIFTSSPLYASQSFFLLAFLLRSDFESNIRKTCLDNFQKCKSHSQSSAFISAQCKCPTSPFQRLCTLSLSFDGNIVNNRSMERPIRFDDINTRHRECVAYVVSSGCCSRLDERVGWVSRDESFHCGAQPWRLLPSENGGGGP